LERKARFPARSAGNAPKKRTDKKLPMFILRR
jgi:hypothetical protein